MINPWIALLSAMLLVTMLNAFIIMRHLTPSLNDNEPDVKYDLRGVPKEHLRHSIKLSLINLLAPDIMPGVFSIVLVDHNESLLFKTIESILTNSTPSLLGEILIIDDGSPTPVVYNHSKVRIIRNDVRTGLIQARNTGGNEARCEYIAVMDSHIKVAKGWLDQPYELMKKDYRTMVSPVVFIMDQEHFEFQPGRNGLMSSAGFYWTFRHKWRSGVPGTMQTAITMGEFFISKRWWTEIEGMDTGMLQWGGENIDISLRTWMCGGQIVVADKTYIAHAFRKKAPYKVDVKNVARNAARSAEVWLGPEYINRFYKSRKIKRGSIDFGDISKPLAMKERLKCHNFSWFVEKFKNISPCDPDDKDCGNYRSVDPKHLDPKFY